LDSISAVNLRSRDSSSISNAAAAALLSKSMAISTVSTNTASAIQLATLNEMGYRVLRFANYDIDRNMDGVLEMIHGAVTSDLNEVHRAGPLSSYGAEE